MPKKRKSNNTGGPSKAVDTSTELARQYNHWKEIYSTENVTLKNEQGTLKAKYALEVQNHAKTTALLADEKAAKKELQTA